MKLNPIPFSLDIDAALPVLQDLLNIAPGMLEIPVVVNIAALPGGTVVKGAAFTAELPGIVDTGDSRGDTVHHGIVPSDTTAEGVRTADALGNITLLFQLTAAEVATLNALHTYDVRVYVLFPTDVTPLDRVILRGQIQTLPIVTNVATITGP